MRKYIQENKLLVIGIALSILFFISFALFNNHIFIFEGDVLNQNVKMTLQAWKRLHEGEGFWWNWSNFLGASYIGTASYYGFGSIFFWLTILVPLKEMVIPMFLYTNILKAIAAVTGGYLWIEKATKSKEGAFAASLIVAFSGFVLTNFNNNVMYDAICFMPWCLYYTECFLKNDCKKAGVAISVGIIGLTNYYFLYLFLPFLCFYALFRYLMLNQFEIKACFKKALEFLVYVFLGIGLSCVLLVPSFYALLNNPRSSELPGLFDTISKFDIYRLITGFLNPVNDWRINNNYYVNTMVYEGIGYSGGMVVYSFILFPFLFPLLLALKNKKEKFCLLSFYGLYGFFCLFKVFYVLFNQNLESRWMMNIVFLNAFLVGTIIAHRKEIGAKLFGISAFLVSGLIAACLVMTHHFYLSPEIWGWKIIVRNACIAIFLLMMYAILFAKVKKDRMFKIGLVFCLIGELGFSYWNIFYNDGYNLDPMSKEELNAYSLDYDSTIDKIKQMDFDFYRIDQMTLKTLHENDSYLYNYHSFNGYTSIYNYNQIPFVDGRFKVSYSWNFYPQPGKWLLKSRLGSKYFIQYDETDQIPYGYSYLFDGENETVVYENQYSLPLAYTKQGSLSTEELSQYSMFMQDRLLINNIALESGDNPDYSMIHNLVEVIQGATDSFEVNVSEYDGGYLYVEFEEHTSVAYEIYDRNNQMIDYNYLIRDLNYSAIPLPGDAARVTITVLHPVNVYYDDMTWCSSWYENTKNESIQNLSWDQNSVSGIMNMHQQGWVFTSIPYDEGWQLKVDGEKHEYICADLGFIGFELEPGEHTIQLDFKPMGLKLGAGFSFISLIGLFCLNRRKTKDVK